MADETKVELGEGELTLQFDGDGSPVDVGYCRSFKVSIDPKYLKIKAGLQRGPIKVVKIDEEIGFDIELLENSARNYAIAMGESPSLIDDTDPDQTVIKLPGISAQFPVEFSATYKVAQLEDKTKYWYFVFYRCVCTSKLDIMFNRDKERILKLQGEALSDPNEDDSQMEIQIDK